MNAKVTWKHGLSFNGSADTGFELPLGADPSVGGANDGFRPLELMAVSLAGCTAMDVISILRKKQQDVTGFEVRVSAEQQHEHPHVFTKAVITYEVTGHAIAEAAVVRAIELSATKYCPAQAMLAKTVPMELVYEIYEDREGVKELVLKSRWQP
ncbi:MAG: OsmC family protein [Anaerolineales bacterium]|nr:OsmC family protein [Anaerolineales bacterium]MCX7755789.1 OsmC family protein [Anaerolineales bacterium]MDW8279047.1 OsmC family protein [Anaerolineales bacterium]